MSKLGDIVYKVWSKNAGPFWLTIDVFCGSPEVFQRVSNGLDTDVLASRLQSDTDTLKRFDIADLNVVKISIPRPAIQGTLYDRDMHGASFAQIISQIEI